MPEAGTIEVEDESEYGLAPPSRTVLVYGEGDEAEAPLAALELGAEAPIDGQRFVRPVGGTGVEVADAGRLDPLDLPAIDWRERGLFDAYSYDVKSMDADGPGRRLRVELDRGRWRIVEPFRARPTRTS